MGGCDYRKIWVPCVLDWVGGVTLDQQKCPGGRWHHYVMGKQLGVQLPLMGNFKGEKPSGPHEMSFMTIACTPASLGQALLGTKWCFLT